MMIIVVILALIVLFGPLRRWAGRHWALLTTIVFSAVGGWIVGSVLAAFCGGLSYMPLLCAIICVIELLTVGPRWLRQVDKDGKE